MEVREPDSDCHGKEVMHKLHTPNKMVVRLQGVEDWLVKQC